LRSEQRATKTLSKYQCALNHFQRIARSAGVRHLSQVDLRLLDQYRCHRTSAGIAAKTLFSETVTIKQLLNFAVSRGFLNTNPFRALKLKKPKCRPQPFWTIDQVGQILTATKGSVYHAVYQVLAETGMRIGEVVFLTWEDLDLDNRILYVREKPLMRGGKCVGIWKPKTGEQRVVPLTQSLVELFRGLPRRRCPWVFSRPSRNSAKPGFTRINDRNVLSHLKDALKTLGLLGHLHTFRHSFISHALTRGVPEAVVRDWVGHVDAQTIRWYMHIADKESHAQMERLFERRATDGMERSSGAEIPDYSI
jgi:integrase